MCAAVPIAGKGHFNLGELYFAAKLFPEAKREYRLALEKNGSSFKPHAPMGLFLLHQEKDAQEAIKHFQRATELAPKRAEPLLGLAFAYTALKDFPKAEQSGNQALQLCAPGDCNYAEAERLPLTIKGQN